MARGQALTGWIVGTEFFNNKHKAIDRAHHNPNLSYGTYWFDNEWDQYDWSVEPKESLAKLEREHCRYLRDKYPILVLAYSGGVDSHTMLHRFIEQGIHIDYIITTLQPGGSNEWYNEEFVLARNYAKSLSNLLPHTKFLTNNESLNFDQYFGNSILNSKLKKIEEFNYTLRFHDVGYSNRLALHHPKIYELIQNNNGAIIVGSNKPSIIKNDHGYWCQFNDKAEENITDTLEFFWSGPMAKLQIKQCHLAVKWLKAHNKSTSEEIYKQSDKILFMDFNKSFGRIDPIHEIFKIKNCHSFNTTGYMTQVYGQNNLFWAKILMDQTTQNNIANIHNEIISRSEQDTRFYNNMSGDLYGWLTKPRFLTV